MASILSRLRKRSIRTTLTLIALVPCLALAGLWTETTSHRLSEGIQLRRTANLAKSFGTSGYKMFYALQRERALTAIWMADPSASSRSALVSQRRVLDAAMSALVSQKSKIDNAPDHIKKSTAPVMSSLNHFSLDDLRKQIDKSRVSRSRAVAAYTKVISTSTSAFDAVSWADDSELVIGSKSLIALVSLQEQVQLADAALGPAVATGRLTAGQRAQLSAAVGAQNYLLEGLPDQLPGIRRSDLKRITNSMAWDVVSDTIAAVLGTPASNSSSGTTQINPPKTAEEWNECMAKVGDELQQLTQNQAKDLTHLMRDKSDERLRQGFTTSAAGLAAVLTAALLSWSISRSVSRRMARLRQATIDLAQHRLPALVDRLNRGEAIDVTREVSELDYGEDELGQVAQAFNSAQRTSVRSAVALADARRGFEKAILGVARHTQNLTNQQLTLLEKMERRHQEPRVLEELYQLDSQASQIRRYEENLAILTGGRPRRRFTEPAPVIDVLRSAVGEVADYQRIKLHADEHLQLKPSAVSDITHLLAELIENAARFSPSAYPVRVRAEEVSKGLAVEVEDRGFGLSEEEYEELTRKLAEPPPFDVLALADDIRLGMFVVSRLASLHAIRVTVRSSPYGGTSAIVLIPSSVIVRKAKEDSCSVRVEAPVHKADTPASGVSAPARPVARSVALAAEREKPRPQSPSTSVPSGSAGGPRREAPPLPQRTSARHSRGPESRRRGTVTRQLPEAPMEEPLAADRAAMTMSAFQRGTGHAREMHAGPKHPDPPR
ncbi:nitrate- and nitrite sensing domain-containing protein [Streptomyces sp. NPDC051776]|uniref:sensor histidine kinase n=1 Tax=Streptomyces sp. NPDC051776 TaxID=3155414 RepID=UPI00342E7383